MVRQKIIISYSEDMHVADLTIKLSNLRSQCELLVGSQTFAFQMLHQLTQGTTGGRLCDGG